MEVGSLGPRRWSELVRIRADWDRLNILDDGWNAAVAQRRESTYSDWQSVRPLGVLIEEMQRLLDRMPRQGRTVANAARQAGARLDPITALDGETDVPEELQELISRARLAEDPADALVRSSNRLVERSGAAGIELDGKLRRLRHDDLPPEDLPSDVKCALVLAVGLLGVYLGMDARSALIPTAIALIGMGCLDLL